MNDQVTTMAFTSNYIDFPFASKLPVALEETLIECY